MMPDTRYQVLWRRNDGAPRLVSLVLDEDKVALASRTEGVKASSARLELCTMVRSAASARNPELKLEPVYFDNLVFRPLS